MTEQKQKEISNLLNKINNISNTVGEKVSVGSVGSVVSSNIASNPHNQKFKGESENKVIANNETCHEQRQIKTEKESKKTISKKTKTSSITNIIINERDKTIIDEISRWKCILGRQIKIMAGFTGERACDRRLKKLIDNGFIERNRYIYGVSGLYSITNKAIKTFGISLPVSEIRLDQIEHDIAVLDTVIYFIKKLNIPQTDIISEKQQRNKMGFVKREHSPDFTFTKENKTYCVEVELSLKAKDRLENIIKQNYNNYDTQEWIIPQSKVKITEIVTSNTNRYPNIEIMKLGTIQEYVSTL